MAVIDGVKRLTGAQVNAPDLRAGAALVIAGLAADGYTVVDEIGYICLLYTSCYLYIKEVDMGQTDIVLGNEEQEALEQALGYVKKN